MEFRNRRVTVMGLGRFGGGVAAAQFLVERGAKVTVTDLRSDAELAESVQQLVDVPIERWQLGEHDERDFTQADFVVVNPAVRRDHPLLLAAENSGAVLTSEMNLFWSHHRGRVIGVTGSNGKSTTAALIHAILSETDHTVRLGGNIGRSLLADVDAIEPNDWTVLELSSFQLHDLDRMQVSPEIAVVTNFSPNHLDWHGDVAAYREAKQTILRWQSAEDWAVLNDDDIDVTTWPVCGQRVGFSPVGTAVRTITTGGIGPYDLLESLRLPGLHNRANALAAIAAVRCVDGVTDAAIRRGLANFRGLPHRLEFVTETSGRRFYNDSLATTPESAIAAIQSFDEPIVLILGGSEKGVDLSQLVEVAATRAKAVALIGRTATQLQTLFNGKSVSFPVRVCSSLSAAVAFACGQSSPGDVVLLSPGCASYDWFRDFTDRGEQFRQLAKQADFAD